MGLQIHSAERKRSKIRVWLSGVSSAGKSLSSLLLALGFGCKNIIMIDSEDGRGEKFAKKKLENGTILDYRVITLDKKTPDEYIEAIELAEKEECDGLIIDSMSHEWRKVLELKNKIDSVSSNPNTWANWKEPTRQHNSFFERINQSPIKFIAMTSRVKPDYVLEENEHGKKVPRKVGLADVQRGDNDYELTVEWRIDKDTHEAMAFKDDTDFYLNKPPKILDESDGQKLREWLEDGVEPCAKCGDRGTETADNNKLYCKRCHEKYREWKAKQDTEKETPKETNKPPIIKEDKK